MRNKRLVLVAGPHASGKDSVVDRLTSTYDRFQRLPRVTTRPLSAGERAHGHYEHLEMDEFLDLESSAQLDFVSHYPEASTAVRIQDLASRGNEHILVVSTNFEDGLLMRARLPEFGFAVASFFIIPVTEEQFRSEEGHYLEELRVRLLERGRPTDDVALRLLVASRYRLALLTQPAGEWNLVENGRGLLSAAVGRVAALSSWL